MKTSKFEINGKNELGSLQLRSLSTSTSVIENVKNFLNEKEFTFNANTIIRSFFKNKNIYAKLGSWKNENFPNGVTITKNGNNLNIDLNKLNNEWNGLSNGLTKSEIESKLFSNIDNNYNGTSSYAKLSETYKSLVNGKDSLSGFSVHVGSENDTLSYNVGVWKTGGNYITRTLLINVINYKK